VNRQRIVAASALVALTGTLSGVLAEASAAQAAAGSGSPSPTAQPEGADATTAGDATTAAGNTAPVANPDTATVVAGRSVTIPVLANDTDAEDQADLVVTGVDDARAAVDATQKNVVFTAAGGDRGPQAFHYTVSDGQESATGDVTVTVTAPPVTRRVTISMPKTVVALRDYEVSGSVNVTAPRPIDVVVQRRTGGSWHAWKSDRADADGDWSVPFSSNRLTTYRFRAVATWGDDKRATSDALSRTVVGRADLTVSGPLSAADVPYSYRSGCPVGPASLRRITVNRFTYSGTVARGSLVVRSSVTGAISRVFTAAFAKRFRIHSMKPTDAFYAGGSRTPTQSDVAAMRADNTSAFNCRPVTGNPYRVSQHSYGNAIDINTVRNPYVVGSRVYPSFARTYLNRSNVRTGMITRRGVVATTFRNLGWPWGARWAHPDYQHFSSNGG
jgi:hypothetical protein